MEAELRKEIFALEAKHQQAEEDLLLFKSIVNQASDAIVIVNPETGRFLDVNDKACSNLGYSREELFNMRVMDIEAVLPNDFSWKKHVREVQKQGYMLLEGAHKRKDGTVFPVWVNVKYLSHGKKDYMVAIIRDITEWKRIEKEIKEKEEQQRIMLQTSMDSFWVIDSEGHIIDVNEAYCRLTGYTREELLKMSIADIETSKTPEEIAQCVSKVIEAGSARFESKHRCKDGRIIDVEVSVNYLPLDGKFFSFMRDITERKKIEEKKGTNQKRFAQEIAESLPGTFCIFDEHGHIEGWNKNFETATGYSAEEISKMHPIDFFVEGNREHMTAIMKEVLSQGKAETETEVLSKDGKRTPYFLMGRKVNIDDKLYVFGLGVDITERKKAEQEFLKMQKLESLGVLAGGIAHNFNNVLTGILGNISLAKMRTGFEEKTSKALNEAEKGCYMAKELTRQLITFAKGGAPIKKRTVIKKLIMDSTVFTLSGSKVKPEFYIADNLWPVEVDEGQISQAINNLVLNADQAMPEGGIIEVGCENVVLSEKDTLPFKSGKYVKIVVRDHGCGIAKEYLGKIFDPYFTTKQKESGLGLAAAYSIINKHNGYITVESELGKGAVFYVYLPVSDQEAR